MLSAVEIQPGYRMPEQRPLGDAVIQPGYRMPMNYALGEAEIGPGYRMPMQQQVLGTSPEGDLFIKNLWFGDPTPPEKSIIPGVISIVASVALIGGLLVAIKKF